MLDVSPETVRNGYALDDLKPVTVSVDDGDSKTIIFAVPTIRSLSGIAQFYVAVVRAYVPVANAVVSLTELNRQAVSDKNGRDLFRNMPVGRFTIAVNGRPYDQVEITTSPQKPPSKPKAAICLNSPAAKYRTPRVPTLRKLFRLACRSPKEVGSSRPKRQQMPPYGQTLGRGLRRLQ